ncbi:hypothetical protein BDZ94DRAFT_1320616 [Collybia nuda]|uniref:Uncharacterized protein n=1 Tax=Collybia nuda TaxID=64659 RepID=A0A9P5Y7K3_9AGAR|nr:hypothetical protein BDZ94DRAFT_1320616 [Collybia nuda]
MPRTREVSVTDRTLRGGGVNDSSSSRESSPRRPNKRSFSPTSDDGDLVIPPIVDDDTPPPPERPIIRQPVAFAWDASSSISSDPVPLNTYQASLPNASALSNASFLPGQVPTPPLPATRKSPATARKGEKTTKKRKITEYSGQTTRFRLSAYDPTVSTEPPLHHGSGPYSAQFRATPSESGYQYSVAPSPTPTLTSLYGYSADGDSSMSISPHPQFPPAGETRTVNTKRVKATEKRAPKRKPTTSRVKGGKTNVFVTQRASTSTVPPSHRHIDDLSANMIPNTNRYYRRNYESDMHSQDSEDAGYLRGDDQSHNRIEKTLSNPIVVESLARHPPARPTPLNKTPASAARERISGGTSEVPDPGVRRPLRQIRMVTILIQDLRSGTTDHQLAEVKIPLKDADDSGDGFWADAKELSEKLQAGPCRIDGPAKVYTLRGKYRQFFLRVSAENVDEFISANIVIKPDRTLNVVVETLLPPGTLPKPPQIPRDLRSPSPEVHELTLDELKDNGARGSYRTSTSPPKNSRSDPSTKESAEQILSPSHRSPLRSIRRKEREKNARESKSPSPLRNVNQDYRPYDSPTSDQESEEIHQLVSTATDSLIRKETGLAEFFRARAAPQRASEVLKQYRFVQKLIDKLVDKKAPFSTAYHLIQPSHIAQALKIDDPKFVSNCTETLVLLELYGINGKRGEDPAVINILNDETDPEYNAKPIKRLLHLLRNIDEAWKKRYRTSISTDGTEGDSDRSPT